MKEDTIRGIQIAANLAVIFTAVLLSAVLVKNYLLSGPAERTSFVTSPSRTTLSNPEKQVTADRIPAGTKLSLSGIDWTRSPQTLLLVLSATCHYCTESAPFYKRLVQNQGNTRFVAVLPQEVPEGRKYLDDLRVKVAEVKQEKPGSFAVRGTPTLILVDNNGAVKNSWLGKLNATEEQDVLRSLQSVDR